MMEQHDVTFPLLIDKRGQEKLLAAFALQRAAKGKGYTDAEAEKLLTWAQWTAFQGALLQHIFQGVLLPEMDNDNINDLMDVTVYPVQSFGTAVAAALKTKFEEIDKTQQGTVPASSGETVSATSKEE